MLNNVKVEDSFVKTGHSNWKNARSADKVFQKHEFLECHQTAIQRHVEITKTAQDVSTKLKNNLTETQCENKASLLKIMSCLRYLYRQRLPFRWHRDDKDFNFKKLLNFRGENDLAFAQWLKKKNETYTSHETQNEMLKDKSLSILRDVVLEVIKSSGYHSIMGDENLISHEDFIGLCETEKNWCHKYGRCD